MRHVLSISRARQRACGYWLLHAFLSTGPAAATEAADNQAEKRSVHDSLPVQLAWVRLEGAEVCPPRSAFESALEKRLGAPPFVAKAARVLTVSLSNEKGPFRAVLALKDNASDEVESKQELFSYSSICDEVFAATVLSVALLLNPDEMQASDNKASEFDQDNSGFFDPPANSIGVGASSPAEAPNEPVAERYEIPIAPRPWARSYAFIGASALVALEQLPVSGPGFAARIELPLDRSWLLWLEGNWLQAQPLTTSARTISGVMVGQDAAWVGAAWLPYATDGFEFHLSGGAGFRRIHATLTGAEPRVHLAIQLGVGSVFYLSRNLALQAQAAAVIPLQQEQFDAWAQPPVGGQLQLGFLVGIPGPTN